MGLEKTSVPVRQAGYYFRWGGSSTVDVETPAPRHELGEDAAQDGANGTGKGPDHADHAIVHATRSVRR